MIPHLCLCSLCFLQSCNKYLINQACSGPYWENIGPRSFLYGPRGTRSVLSRPRADILPVRPSRLVNKIYILPVLKLYLCPVKRKFSFPRCCCVHYVIHSTHPDVRCCGTWFGEQQAKLIILTGQEGQLPLVKATFSERLVCIANIF